jgi:ABC-type transport system involved in cytochrome c biogenesis permease subunit
MHSKFVIKSTQKSSIFSDKAHDVRSLLVCLIFLIGFSFALLNAQPEQDFPVLYKGRYRPAEAYARLWLNEIYHSQTLKHKDWPAFHTTSSSPLNLLWSFNTRGHLPYEHAPLFWIGSFEIKQFAQLPVQKDRFSFLELQHSLHQKNQIKGSEKKLDIDWAPLSTSLKEFEQLQNGLFPTELAYRNRLSQLQSQGIPPKEIEVSLEQEFPLHQRLQIAGTLFKSLPGRYKNGEWFSLKALSMEVYQPSSNSLKPVGNFTLFSDADFESVRQAYFALDKAIHDDSPNNIQQEVQHRMGLALKQAYQPMEGMIFQEAHGKRLTYPTSAQLRLERLYVSYPWIPVLILLYALGACLSIVSYCVASPLANLMSIGFTGFAILGHTALLAIRCFILGRPPVSNMFETVIYVAWVTACISLLFPAFRRQSLVLLAASLSSIILLLIIEITGLNQSLDHVQAVLDSQFWLMIHVLLVVGSYGIFMLGAIIGHFYLGLFMIHRQEAPTMAMLSRIILQTMHGGTILLIAGTILGGVWAAESWGRFWDWDPKESWAFISSCIYLIWIHAYRFHHIASFGLAIGAVSGFLAISFTWYGVNYILGTGLHSYGFGSGGERYYYAYFVAECIFLIGALGTYVQSRVMGHDEK